MVLIETGKSNFIENIKKSSDFHKIICVATSSQAEKITKEKLIKENIETDKVWVIGCKEYSMPYNWSRYSGSPASQ